MAYIVFENDDEKILVELEPGEEYMVGRVSSCDLRFSSKERVSRRHCVVYYSEDQQSFVVEDLGSTNGTFVNDKKIDRPTSLHNRDEIKAGYKSLFYFENIGEATDTERKVSKVAVPVKVFGFEEILSTSTESISKIKK